MTLQDIALILYRIVDIYTWILLGRILLSWLPNLDWDKQPWATIRALTEPVMEPFRRLIPPLGGIDFSPMVLFLVLRLLQDALIRLV